MRTAIIIAFLIALSACGPNQPDADDEASLSANAVEEKGGESYKEFDQRRDFLSASRGTFAGQGCTQDCSGHDAGYAWAEDKGITDPDDCGGKSWSFIEGCRAYAEQAFAEEGN